MENVNKAMQAFDGNEKLIDEVMDLEIIINQLEKEITKFLVSLSNSNLSETDYMRATNLYHTLNDIERIGDHAENIAELARFNIEHNLIFSDDAVDELHEMIKKVDQVVRDAITSLENDDIALARTIYLQEEEIDRLEVEFRAEHINRLNNQLCNPSLV